MDVWELPKAWIALTLRFANSFLSLQTWTTSHEGNPFKTICSWQSIFQKKVLQFSKSQKYRWNLENSDEFRISWYSIIPQIPLRTLWTASNNSHGKGPSDHTRIGTGLEFSKHRDVMCRKTFVRLCDKLRKPNTRPPRMKIWKSWSAFCFLHGSERKCICRYEIWLMRAHCYSHPLPPGAPP